MCGNANKQRKLIRAMAAGLMMMVAGAGCETPPTQIDPMGDVGPIDCNDLKLGPLLIAEIPFPQEDSHIVHADTMFHIRWFAEFERGANMNYFGATGEYRVRVTIEEDDEEIMSILLDATPLNVASGAYDEVVLEDGLPAGTYTIRVILDVDNEVDQCHDLVSALNNVRQTELVIEPQPLDLESTPTGQSGDDDDDESSSPFRTPTRR
ncbi:MAG TPA: hypothetical protein P5081_12830 [Phycisphaerae bacterium]|nr:hypothetical protein [Phycisphaerae bacterium]HRW53762.1 hypothetical protein [Phycisphaerae bacterium]